MSTKKLISRWNADPTIASNIYAKHSFPARASDTRPFPSTLHPAIVNALKRNGIEALYSHQLVAWDCMENLQSIVVATGTSSGKSLCYNIPIVDRFLNDPSMRALYLFPTKALAQDQAQILSNLTDQISNELITEDSHNHLHDSPELSRGHLGEPNPISVYDGDTPTKSRPLIRSNARIILTNPDMLHYGILPQHTFWDTYFSNLNYIVIDEIHTYRGVFGSHVANVIRRLKRITNFYGGKLQFILTSATIANPVELAERLIEESVILLDTDGSSRGDQEFIIYNPPIVNQELGLRRSAIHESIRLADDLLAYDIQSIIFGRSRRTIELILSYLRDKGHASDMKNQEFIRGYRSGYLPGQRRAIEQGIREGVVKVVVATNALELGIDIGGMGAVLMVGYPGTIAATLQQAGRAGRGEKSSLAILVATADPLDQFLALHPEFIFERAPEQALIDPDNLLILLAHIKCAAFELSFEHGENFGLAEPQVVQEILEFLTHNGELHESGERYFWMVDQSPAQAISLRSTTTDNVTLQIAVDQLNDNSSRSNTIGVLDKISAMWMAHPNAIYLHEGEPYLVSELDLENNIAWLSKTDSDYFTEPRRSTEIQLLQQISESSVRGAVKSYGEVKVTSQVIGYRLIKWFSHEQIDIRELSLPPTELETTAYWLSLSETTVEMLRESELWKNDPNDYGPEWNKKRQQVRARDGYRCQICGAQEAKRSFDVHHKIPFRMSQIRHQANALENLITLCPRCHRRVERNVRVRSGLAGVAYVFGHLAPLFLMCDIRDIGVHADPNSPLANGNPAIILYDQIPAGIGLSQKLYEFHEQLIGRAVDLVAACNCPNGCPSCVGPGGEHGQGGKIEALAILQELIGNQ